MILPRVFDGLHLRMRASGFVMEATSDDPFPSDNDRADGWVRAGQADTTLRFVQREVHPAVVVGLSGLSGGGHE